METNEIVRAPRRLRQVLVRVGPVTVGLAGVSAAVLSTATVVMALGVAVALASAGFGAYTWLASRASPGAGSGHHEEE